MSNERAFTGTLTVKRDVTVYAETPEEAADIIMRMHMAGDACADLDDTPEVLNVRETDEEGNEFLDLYLFCDDETATLWETPLVQVPANIEEIDDALLRRIFLNSLSEHNRDYTEAEVEAMDRKALVAEFYHEIGVNLNKAALVPQSQRATIAKIGESLSEDFGGDSATYRACEHFGETLAAMAVKILDFPTYDEDDYDE